MITHLYFGDRKIAIYPNPNQGEFYIDGTYSIEKIENFDISGKVVFQEMVMKV